MALVVMTLGGCTPKKTEITPIPPANLFDYSRSDLGGLVEFANRFGTLPDSARIAVCREMEVSEKEVKNDQRGLTLHQAAGQLFLASCTNAPGLQEKLKALAENSELPLDQRQFAGLAQQLIASHEIQNNALIQAQKKVRTKSAGGAARRKTDPSERETPLVDDPSKPAPPAPLTDDVARKKLEALRNLEKSMDRDLKP